VPSVSLACGYASTLGGSRLTGNGKTLPPHHGLKDLWALKATLHGELLKAKQECSNPPPVTFD